MIEIDEARLAKLPKWAREQIKDLVRELTETKARLARLGGSLGDSGLFAVRGYRENLHVLPISDYHVELRSQGRTIVRVRESDDGGGIVANSLHAIKLLPMASNTVDVRPDLSQ